MKLLFFIYSLRGGGAERVTANLANYWTKKGWEITIVTLTPRQSDDYQLLPSVERVCLNLTRERGDAISGLWQNARRISALRHVLRASEPDIALGMMWSANVLLALAGRGLPVCTIGSERIHPPQYPLGLIWGGLRRRSYGWLDAVTALTEESARWLEANTKARRVAIIPNAVTWPLPVQAPIVRPDSVCAFGRKILLGVGRLDAQKGFDCLVEAFAGLAGKFVEWDLVIAGDGPLRPVLESQIRKARLERRVFLPGRVGNMGEWYERADLYVMSSRYEGFPNTLVEAMAHGLAAVSFDCDTGPRDIIRHEIDGLLVPNEDIGKMASVLDRLMDDANLRAQYAVRAAETVERFANERIADMWRHLFERVVNERTRN